MTSLQLNLKFDQSQFQVGRAAVRHLIARITPPPRDPSREPLPLDLAIVIDASGSMSGAPLAAAKEATVRLASQLPASTRLSIVSFADDVVIHADGVRLDAPGRAEVTERIRALRTRGSTNLHAGWRTACELLSAGEPGPGRSRHVIVLSDGCANTGIVDPQALACAARQFLESGIATTCVGIGDHYSPVQLSALAEHGGGECHDAENAVEIVEVLLGTTLSLAEVVAEDVQLVIDVDDGVVAGDRAGSPATFDGRRLVIRAGAVRAGIERTVVVRLDVPAVVTARAADRGIAVGGRVTWRAPGSSERIAGPSLHAVAVPTQGEAQLPAVEDARAVLTAWQADLVRRATELNRDGAFAAVEDLWRVEGEPFLAYASQHRETAVFAETIERLRRTSLQPMFERSRMLVRDMATKAAFQQGTYYRANKGDLFTVLGDDEKRRTPRGPR
jgi:Ca-activated chloride channel family protein